MYRETKPFFTFVTKILFARAASRNLSLFVGATLKVALLRSSDIGDIKIFASIALTNKLSCFWMC